MRPAAVWLLAAVWPLAVGLAACSTQAPSNGSADSLAVRRVTLAGQSWTLLVAPPDGMRDRPDFGAADGMLFDLGAEIEPTAVAFVMDRVAFALDIAWFDGDGVLVGTATMPICPAVPCPLHRAPGPYRWAIEAPVGALTSLEAGDRLEPGSSSRSVRSPTLSLRRDPVPRGRAFAGT